VNRRRLLSTAVLLLAASVIPGCAQQAPATVMQVRRDAGCGCCEVWTRQMEASGRFRTMLINEADMSAVKRRLGVPDGLTSCHTAEVDGFVIEGHVPVREIVRLLEARPVGVRGLAVAGMPAGSPGMEMPDGRRDAFDVVAFGAESSVFANYPAST
jgi:hypothetical protein